MIFFTSDLHLGHDKKFIYGPRGFDSLEDYETQLVNKWNLTVNTDDTVYILGDLILGENREKSLRILETLNGNFHVILGNHDTLNKIEEYKKISKIKDIQYASIVKYKKYQFFLCHYPTLTSNLSNTDSLTHHLINLFGHTHSKNKFYEDIPFMYNVALDAHQCCPVDVETVLYDIKKESNKLCEENFNDD